LRYTRWQQADKANTKHWTNTSCYCITNPPRLSTWFSSPLHTELEGPAQNLAAIHYISLTQYMTGHFGQRYFFSYSRVTKMSRESSLWPLKTPAVLDG